MTIKDKLAEEISQWRARGHWRWLGEFILRHGVSGQPVAHGFERGPRKSCYKNAALLALAEPDLVYCEGYALMRELPVLVDHAWVMRGAEVIDVTWPDALDCQYLGVPIGADVLMDELLRNEVYGVFDIGAGLNGELLRKLDPQLAAEMEAKAPLSRSGRSGSPARGPARAEGKSP